MLGNYNMRVANVLVASVTQVCKAYVGADKLIGYMARKVKECLKRNGAMLDSQIKEFLVPDSLSVRLFRTRKS